MAATKLNLLYGVVFNREVGQDAALYWEKEEGRLSALIDQADRMPAEEIETLGRKAKRRISDAYRWQLIADQYADLWRNAGEKKKI